MFFFTSGVLLCKQGIVSQKSQKYVGNTFLVPVAGIFLHTVHTNTYYYAITYYYKPHSFNTNSRRENIKAKWQSSFLEMGSHMSVGGKIGSSLAGNASVLSQAIEPNDITDRAEEFRGTRSDISSGSKGKKNRKLWL